MIKVKEQSVRGCTVGLYTHDGYYFVIVEDRETGYQGEAQRYGTIEEANKQYDVCIKSIQDLV